MSDQKQEHQERAARAARKARRFHREAASVPNSSGGRQPKPVSERTRAYATAAMEAVHAIEVVIDGAGPDDPASAVSHRAISHLRDAIREILPTRRKATTDEENDAAAAALYSARRAMDLADGTMEIGAAPGPAVTAYAMNAAEAAQVAAYHASGEAKRYDRAGRALDATNAAADAALKARREADEADSIAREAVDKLRHKVSAVTNSLNAAQRYDLLQDVVAQAARSETLADLAAQAKKAAAGASGAAARAQADAKEDDAEAAEKARLDAGDRLADASDALDTARERR